MFELFEPSPKVIELARTAGQPLRVGPEAAPIVTVDSSGRARAIVTEAYPPRSTEESTIEVKQRILDRLFGLLGTLARQQRIREPGHPERVIMTSCGESRAFADDVEQGLIERLRWPGGEAGTQQALQELASSFWEWAEKEGEPFGIRRQGDQLILSRPVKMPNRGECRE